MAYLSSLAQGLVPYQAGEQPKDQVYIKLNTNENPYPPSPRVREALQDAAGALRLYPDMDSTDLCRTIAELHDVSPQQVFIGNGSDEILAFAFAAFFAGKRLLAPDVTYSFYPVYARLFGVHYETVALKDDFSVDVPGLMQSAPIVLANPNAPTGRALPLCDIARLAEHAKAHEEILLVDEAYAAFAQENALPLIREMDNVLIVRTLSKSHCLAGLRVGYAIGGIKLIEGLNRVKNCFNSYPVDRLAQAAARAAMEDTEYYEAIRNKVIAARETAQKELAAAGITVIPSETNFLFVKADESNAAPVQQALKSQGILVRHFTGARTAPYLRITIGTPGEMELVTKSLIALCGRKD